MKEILNDLPIGTRGRSVAPVASRVTIGLDLHRESRIGERPRDPVTEGLAGRRSIGIRQHQFVQYVDSISFALASVLIAGVNLYALALVLQNLLGWSLFLAIVVALLFLGAAM